MITGAAASAAANAASSNPVRGGAEVIGGRISQSSPVRKEVFADLEIDDSLIYFLPPHPQKQLDKDYP